MIDLTNCRHYYRELECLIPKCEAQPTCFCHYPKHRGHGGRNAGWAYNEGVPLCFFHHEALDARAPDWKTHMEVLATVKRLVPAFWESVRAQAEDAA